MDLTVPDAARSELAAAFFQAAITLALAVLCAWLYRRYRKPYFGWWAVAWSLYVLRLVAIISFVLSGDRNWLYWHQVITGWTALALLWAALVFSQQLRWRQGYLALVLFPPLWSYVAIYRLDSFLLAAGPAVLFLSGATLWTAWAFFRYHRQARSTRHGAHRSHADLAGIPVERAGAGGSHRDDRRGGRLMDWSAPSVAIG